MASTRLNVQMLGGFSVHLDGQPFGPLRSRAAQSLLAFLITHRDRAQTRDLLAGRFWSDLPEDKARRRLSNALWRIRSATPPAADGSVVDPLEAASQSIQLNPELEVVVDVDVFIRALDEMERRHQVDGGRVMPHDLATVVDAYQGDLLSGHYEEWIEGPRHQVRSRYLGAVAQMVQLHSGLGDWMRALHYARILIEAEPLGEEWHLEMIRLYALNGQPSAAERHYEELCHELETDLGVEPGAEIKALMERIRSDASTPPAVEVDDADRRFVGRATERSTLLGRVNDLVSGKGGVVLVEGEAGIGKSRLMYEVSSGAEWRGVQVLAGGHAATTTLRPYEGLQAALAPATTGVRGERVATHLPPVLLYQASTVLPGLASFVDPGSVQALRPSEELWRTTESLAQVILAQANPRSTLLILEDVQWCDEETMHVLLRLGERLIESGVLVCLTYRREEAEQSPAIWQALAELEATPGSSRLVLGSMSDDEVRQLVHAELGPGRIPEPALRSIVASTAGNPYVVLEALRSPLELFEGDDTGPGDDLDSLLAGEQEAEVLLPALADLLSRRIEVLEPGVRSVLEALALLAGPATSGVVARAAGLDRASVAQGLAAGVDLGFVVESDGKCEFAQEQTRRAVEELMDPGRRAEVHARIVAALAARGGAGVEQLAHHAWQAGDWSAAYRYHRTAADSARAVNAFAATAEHLAKADEAASRAGVDDRARVEDLLLYDQTLEVLGRRTAQQELLQRLAAIRDLDRDLALRVVQHQAWLLLNTDRSQEALRLAQDTLDSLGGGGPGTAALLGIVGTARAWTGDSSGALEPLTRAVKEMKETGVSSIQAQLTLGRAYADLHQPDLARQHLVEAYEEADTRDLARDQVEALGHLASLHMSQRDEAASEAALLEALELAVEIGYRYGEGVNLVNLAVHNIRLGRGGRALELIERATGVFASLGNGRGEAFVKVNHADLAHKVLGNDELAWRLAEDGAVFFRRTHDPVREAFCLSRLARIDLRLGRRRMARRRLQAALERSSEAEDPATVVDIQHDLALVELVLDHPERALEWTAPARGLIERWGLEGAMPASLVLEARARAGLGETEAVIELVNRSIGLNRPGAEMAHLVAWWSYELLAAAGHESAAAEQVALAFELLSQELEEVPEAQVRQSWTVVPEHRAIAEGWERHFVRRVEWRLPWHETPAGRPVDSADLLDVVWTVSEPADWLYDVPAERRRRRIVRLADEAVEQGALARITDLANVLDVTERTIKRDLAVLREQGQNPPIRGRTEENS